MATTFLPKPIVETLINKRIEKFKKLVSELSQSKVFLIQENKNLMTENKLLRQNIEFLEMEKFELKERLGQK